MEWEKFHQEQEIALYRAPKSAEGLIPFKAEATFKGNIEHFLMALLYYPDKPKWAPKLKKVVVHKRLGRNRFVFSEYYKTPWPATDREFLLEGNILVEGTKEKRIYKLIAHNSKELSFARDGHIVCDVSLLNLTLESVSPEQTFIRFEFLGDMKGWMPTWLINIIQKKWPLRFLQGLKSYVA